MKCKYEFNENYEINFFTLKNGNVPIEEFLDSLNEKMLTKVVRSIQLLSEYGKDLSMPHSAYVKDGIFELRVKLASNIVRLFYFFDKGKIIILTNGYYKKQQKVSKKDLNLAIKYMSEYKGE